MGIHLYFDRSLKYGQEGVCVIAIVFGQDPVRAEVARVLELLASTAAVSDIESALVDVKEEAGRRDSNGDVLPGTETNDLAADKLASAAACMANSPGGGALIVGVADDGELIGTRLDAQWLRHRIYDLTSRSLTVDVSSTDVDGVRILVLKVPEAIEPIRWRQKIRWRVDHNCVEVDAASWHSKRMLRTHFDWSAQDSQVPVAAVRAAALDQARYFLRTSLETAAAELAADTDPQLLRRLNVVTADGMLTNAGVLAFVGRGEPGLDYIRRDVAGGDSVQRVRRPERGLIEELAEVFANVESNNETRHLRTGLVVGQLRDLPEGAVREAIVNGLAHREWGIAEPTIVEHVGATLRVTSPGGFFGGVTADNIITHPSQSRNRSLAELFAALRIAERQGVGVDRMVRDMIRLGHMPPDIDEVEGPFVRAALVGDAVDEAWISWLDAAEPSDARDDLNSLLLTRLLVDRGWFDEAAAAPVLQLGSAETRGAVKRLTRIRMSRASLVRLVRGVPEEAPPAWSLDPAARLLLQRRDAQFGTDRRWPSREQIARSYANARGRVGTSELASMVGASATNVGHVLKTLEQEGLLEPAWPSRRGPGFYYRLSRRSESAPTEIADERPQR